MHYIFILYNKLLDVIKFLVHILIKLYFHNLLSILILFFLHLLDFNNVLFHF